MTKFTINNKDYTHKELNLIRDFFTDDQWNIIDYALDEYKQSGEVVIPTSISQPWHVYLVEVTGRLR